MSDDDLTAGPSRARWRTATLVVMALAGVASLVALILILSSVNQQRDAALRAQRHSYDVMVLARTLAGTIARAEAALGRYVISADRQLGQLFADDWAAAGTQLDRLDRITDDNPGQQRRIDALRLAYLQRGDELSLTALSTRYGKNSQALARYYASREAPALVQINRELDRITDLERGILEGRAAAAQRTVARSNQIAGALAGFGALLVLGAAALGWITVKSLSDAAIAEAEADAARDRAEALSEAVRRATDELRVQEARLRQVQKMEAVGQLTGGIAHDFNNMLAVVTGGLELAARALPADPASARRHLDSAAEGADRAAALTRRLLAFSREDSLKPEPLRLGALVSGMRDLLDRTLGDGVSIRLEDAGGGWCVRADKVQMENAILNLAVNARDAMNGRGDLTIATGATTLRAGAIGELPPGDYLTLTVTDSGCGMSPEVAERVFEPFFTTKEVGKGTGLGLSQIFALVRQLGGDVAIDTAPGRGTAVTLRLPRDEGAGIRDARPEPAPAILAAPRALDVLVVEDDPRVLAATMAALAELGHRARACSDPLAAPAALAEGLPVDLIMTDVLMPRQTGPEMIAALPPHWASVPVLFVTGFAGEANTTGIAGRPVLRKPFTLAALEAALAEAAPDLPPEQIAAE